MLNFSYGEFMGVYSEKSESRMLLRDLVAVLDLNQRPLGYEKAN